MEKTKFIGKKYNLYTKYNTNGDESEIETLDIKSYSQRNYEPKKNIETSSKKNEMKNIIKKKEDTIDIREETFTPTKRNTILEGINKLKYKNKIIEKNIRELTAGQKHIDIDILEKKVRILQNDIEGLKKDNLRFHKDNVRFHKDNEKLTKKGEKLENDLKINKIELQTNYKKLEDEIDLLKIRINNLEEFQFSTKLHKLLKNLIGYIIKRFYPHYMIYKENKKRIVFIKAPRFPYNLVWAKDEEIINTLNRLVEFLFTMVKEKDCVIHFVDMRGERKSQYRKIFKVFDKPDDFFRYFNISPFDRSILIELIPETYFTQIDNICFEIKIKALMGNILNEK